MLPRWEELLKAYSLRSARKTDSHRIEKSVIIPLAPKKQKCRVEKVRVLIQNCLTEKFFSAKKRWVLNVRRGKDFGQTLRAWEEIDDSKLTGVQIIVTIGGKKRLAVSVVGKEGEKNSLEKGTSSAGSVRKRVSKFLSQKD